MTHDTPHPSRTAIVTGASAGLGRALSRALAHGGWRLIIDGRRPGPLAEVAEELAARANVTAVAGDVTDPVHRQQLLAAAGPAINLLINNASELGNPLTPLRELTPENLERLWRVNVSAPLALVQAVLPRLTPSAVVIDISSDAAVEHYETWGGYGATKAALDHLTLTLAAEEPAYRFYAVDPGDMQTALHQAAFSGEDIRDRPLPESVVPRLLGLLNGDRPSGRYRLADLPIGSARELEESRR